MNHESQNPMFHTEIPAAARAMEPGTDETPRLAVSRMRG